MGNSASVRERVALSLEVEQLKAEVESLKCDNSGLRKELRKKHRTRTRSGKTPSEVAPEKVDAFVDGLLADPDTNLTFVPDMIERPAQRTMLLFLLKSIAHAVDTSAIEFMGHEIVMRMQPKVMVEPDTDIEDKRYSDYTDEDYESARDSEMLQPNAMLFNRSPQNDSA